MKFRIRQFCKFDKTQTLENSAGKNFITLSFFGLCMCWNWIAIFSQRRRYGLILKRRGPFRGYSAKANPSIINSFSTAAFRFGHSLVRNHFSRPGFTSFPTRTNFFNPCPLHQNGVDSIFQGLAKDPAQSVDGWEKCFSCLVIRILTNPIIWYGVNTTEACFLKC